MSLLSNNQDLRKLTFKTPYVGANGIRPHAHVVPVGKSCTYNPLSALQVYYKGIFNEEGRL